jgi:hypothetical protein
MDAPGLTKTRILVAIMCGILVAFVYTYATVPHLVSTPVQVITPVPTPPPVVITNQPISPSSYSYARDYLMSNLWWLMAIMLIIPIIIFVIGIVSSNDNDEYHSRSSSGSGMISLIITIIIMGLTLWILSIVIDSMMKAISVLP